MTSDVLASVSGIVLSLVLAYVPGLSERYNALDGAYKRTLMGALLCLTAVGVYAVSCAGLAPQLGVTAECSQSGAVEIVRALIAALIASQGAYLLLVRRPRAHNA